MKAVWVFIGCLLMHGALTAQTQGLDIRNISGEHLESLLQEPVGRVTVEWPTLKQKPFFEVTGSRLKQTFFWCNGDARRGSERMSAGAACAQIADAYRRAGDVEKESEALIVGCQYDLWFGQGEQGGCSALVGRLLEAENPAAAQRLLQQYASVYRAAAAVRDAQRTVVLRDFTDQRRDLTAQLTQPEGH